MATQTLQANFVARAKSERKGAFAYGALLLFSILYFARPEDVIPGLGIIPVAKITGAIALVSLVLGIVSRTATKKFPIELRLLTALFIWQVLTVPFAFYKSGALGYVTTRCAKAYIAAILVSMLVSSLKHLRKLMYVQAAAVAAMTFASVLLYKGGRMGGVLGGVFDNPNDLAVSIAMTWPLCIMFMVRTRNPLKKLLWAVGLVFLLRGLMLTYSRTGFLALGVATIFCLAEFGLRGKRYHLIAIAIAGVIIAASFAPSGYGERIESIFGEPLAVGDSQMARKDLLIQSLKVTATHPLFGVGPGNFASYTETWRVTHNTYTEFSSECGIPALIMFLFVLHVGFRNVSNVRKSQLFAENADVRFLTGGLWASLAGYVVGAFFASTAYQLFPYFLVGYTTALFHIAAAAEVKPAKENPLLRTWNSKAQLVSATTKP